MSITNGCNAQKRCIAIMLAVMMCLSFMPQRAGADSETYTVKGAVVNIRAKATTDSSIVTTAQKGDKVTVTGTSGDWYSVKYGGSTGYIRKDMLTSSTSTGSSSEMSATAKVTGSSVNIRKSATTDSAVLKKVDKGTVMEAISYSGGWVKVSYDGVTGYVSADYVSVSGLSTPDSTSDELKSMDATGKVTGSGLMVRKSASKSADSIDKLDKGDTVTITGKQGDWYRVRVSGGTGYVLASYIEITSSGSTTTTTTTNSTTSVTAMNGTGTITGSTVNVRKSASKDSSLQFQLDKGNTVTITGKSGDWYQISCSKGSGFVLKEYVSASAVSATTTLKQGQNSDEVKSMQKRLIELEYLSGSADGDFGANTLSAVKAFQIKAGLSADGIAGAGTLKALYASDAPKAGSSTLPTAAPTTAPATSYTTLKQGSTGDAVQKLQSRLKELGYLSGSADGDFGSATAEAVKAFQKKASLTADGIAGEATQKALYASSAPSNSTGTTTTTTETTIQTSISSTLTQGSNGSEVKELQQRLISLGYLSGSADGDFGAKTLEAVKLFQKQADLTVDGKAGATTIKKLFSSSAAKYDGTTKLTSEESSTGKKVYLIDWWTGGIQDIFSRGTIATVTDVKTGLTWQVKRRGGTNHADVEPLTAADTAKMKQAYGGTWSWNRRAIWVTVGGKTYAASMNGMPHTPYSITDNNFPGHHCIHFLNSRTHTGNRWDTDHQNCVQYAYEQGNK